MQLANLEIQRVIIHQVNQRDVDGNQVPPIQSHEFTNFDADAMTAFKSRVQEALGEGSKAVQMEIVAHEDSKLPKLIASLIDEKDDKVFAGKSFEVAKKLSDAQQSKGIPGGIVVVFSGTQGASSTAFVGVIKAEIYSAYQKEVNEKTNEISLKFIKEALLTPGSRLYKTAGYFEKKATDSSVDLNERFVVMVSDYQINKAEGKAAAQYFYSDFLGCGYLQDSARKTKHFYEAATNFIADLDVGPAKKNDLQNALTTYLKVETASTISVADYGAKYLELDQQDDFMSFMKDAGVPSEAFTKDVEHVANKLKFRSVTTSRKVKISAPAEAFKDLVIVEAFEGDLDESGAPAEWTRVIIKDRILDQE